MRVMLQIVASLADDSKGIIYKCNIFIVQAIVFEGKVGGDFPKY
jgi:hypothetical protein